MSTVTEKMSVKELTGFIQSNADYVAKHSPELFKDIQSANEKAKKKQLKKADLYALAKVIENFVEIESKKTEKVENSVKQKKENKSVTKRSVQEQELVLADTFPAEVTVGKEVYKKADIKDMTALRRALEQGKEIVFACYWTKRHLKQFSYGIPELHSDVTEFPDDLDIAQAIYVSDEDKVAYAVSVITEHIYTFLAVDIPEYEGIRFCNGMEFQIYAK